MQKYCFGVDVGGTSVKLGLFTIEGKLVDKWEIRTRKENNGSDILPDIASSIKQNMIKHKIEANEIKGIGMGVPGPVLEDGTVLDCVNLGWGQFNVRDKVKELTGIVQVEVNNDANVAALGEMWMGGGIGYQNIVMITLGTGVGGGIIQEGKILNGVRGAAGEIGHITVNSNESEFCNCGKQGCLEQYASATGIAIEARKYLAQSNEPTKLKTKERLSAKDVFDAAKEGDEVALELVDMEGKYLGLVTSCIAAVIDPEAFVIGGGVSKAGAILTDTIQKHYEKNVMAALRGKDFKLATLGNDAGIYGSAKMILNISNF